MYKNNSGTLWLVVEKITFHLLRKRPYKWLHTTQWQ